MIKSSLDQLAKTEEIEVIWKSYELRPAHAPPLSPEYEKAYQARIAAGWPQVQQMAQERFDIEMKTHRWGVKSRSALEGAKYAEEKGFGEAYHEAIFRAYFVEDRDIGDLPTLGDLAAEVGLDRADFLAALEAGAYTAQVEAEVKQAQQYGLQGVPAIIIEQKYLISGAQPLEALQEIVQQIKQRKRNGE